MKKRHRFRAGPIIGPPQEYVEDALNELNRVLARNGEPVIFCILLLSKSNEVSLISNRAVIPEVRLMRFGEILTDAIKRFGEEQ